MAMFPARFPSRATLPAHAVIRVRRVCLLRPGSNSATPMVHQGYPVDFGHAVRSRTGGLTWRSTSPLAVSSTPPSAASG